MAITVKYLTDLGIEKDVADKIFAERGIEMESEKAKLNAVKAELEERKKAFESLTNEFDKLKTSNATADDYKAKYEAIVAENQAKERQAEADRITREKEESIARRFGTVVGEKQFNHEAIKDSYLKKFSEALEDKNNEGLSDEQIFHNLTKDDKGAFVGVQVVRLAGGAKNGVMPDSKYSSRDEIIKIKDTATRQNAMLTHPHLFPEIQGKN